MKQIIDLHQQFYMDLADNPLIRKQLTDSKIGILDGFITNIELVRTFYQTYYATPRPRVVLCGINPGRKGAGKTGVPFIDYKSLSKLLPHVNETDEEQSSQFVSSIIHQIGPEHFFNTFYLTNISWFGFTRNGLNLNYYDLPGNLPSYFTQAFAEEMKLINYTDHPAQHPCRKNITCDEAPLPVRSKTRSSVL
ncbi:hypothetical protein JCM19045_1706 [Bacillus sp. JCM 19045]|nr:hypothetical protein JCM19045_1706 [Bacillus sp. JCM 19045]